MSPHNVRPLASLRGPDGPSTSVFEFQPLHNPVVSRREPGTGRQQQILTSPIHPATITTTPPPPQRHLHLKISRGWTSVSDEGFRPTSPFICVFPTNHHYPHPALLLISSNSLTPPPTQPPTPLAWLSDELLAADQSGWVGGRPLRTIAHQSPLASINTGTGSGAKGRRGVGGGGTGLHQGDTLPKGRGQHKCVYLCVCVC